MKVEIDRIREVKEVTIGSDGRISYQAPEYAGYLAKILIIDERREMSSAIEETPYGTTESNRIEGKRYAQGHVRSRETTKEFFRLISSKGIMKNKNGPWLTLNNGALIRYRSSVIYDGSEGDFLWFTISYDELADYAKKKDVFLVFIIRDSQKMVYFRLKDVINEFKKANDFRKGETIHLHIIFTNGKIKLQMKTGKDNQPVEKEFDKVKNYVSWDDFVEIVEG